MKKISKLLFIMIMSFCLVACGNSENDEGSTSTPKPTETNVPIETVTATKEPEVTEAPTTTETPEITEVPEVTETPEIIETPEITEEPEVTDAPSQDIEPASFIPFIQGSACKTHYNSDYTLMDRLTVPYIQLAENYREELFKLSMVLNSITRNSSGYADTVLEELKEMAQEGYDSLENKEEFSAYFDDVIPTIVRCDTQICSVLFTEVSYVGGIHPDRGYYAYNFYTPEGQVLTIADVFNDYSALRKALVSETKEQYPDTSFMFLEDTIAQEIADNSITFILGQDGISFYFSPYEVASYADGDIVVHLSYDKYADIIKPGFNNVADNYTFMPIIGTPYFVDIDNDGVVEKFQINAVATNEYDEIGTVSFVINDETVLTQDIIESYDLTPYFVKTPSGNCFVYIETVYMSDDASVLGFRFENGKVIYVGEVANAIASSTDETDEWYYFLADAFKYNEIKILQRSDLVSTSYLTRYYEVAIEDGTLGPISEYFLFESYKPELTTLVEIVGKSIDEEGNVIEDMLLTPGQKLTAQRMLDDYQTIDFTLEDGSWFRITFEHPDFGTLDGVPAYELFDGTMFCD